MGRTCNYLKTVWQDLLQNSNRQPVFPAVLLVLLALPMGYAVISVSLMLLVGASIYSFKKENLSWQLALVLPMLLFVLMAVSLCWTQDWDASVKALQKGLPLLLVPICFLGVHFNQDRKRKLLEMYCIGMAVFTIFVLLRAVFRYAESGDRAVFFYHALVTEDVNAIHVSTYIALAFCACLGKAPRNRMDYGMMALFAVFLVLLSSKNIIVVALLLSGYYFWRRRSWKLTRKRSWMVVILLFLAGLAMFGKIKNRFAEEFQREGSINQEISARMGGNVYNVGVAEAWSQEQFNGNDYFAGTAFRVYQLRIFIEMMTEDAAWLTGYGLNATDSRVREKGIQYGVYKGTDGEGYLSKNFHNQYIQLFAELGFFGFALLLAMLGLNLKNALQNKDFVHISFAILMISLFLTESFLSRQRGIVFFTIVYCLLNARMAFQKE